MMFRSLALAAATLIAVAPLEAQRPNIARQIHDNQERLDSIRRHREALEDQLNALGARVRSLTSEIENIEQQKQFTTQIVNELDRQMMTMTAQVDTVTMEVLLAQDALAEKQAILQKRLVEIYKRGQLYAFEALLAAESFGELVGRYKYLFLVTRQDRALVEEVSVLRDRVAAHRRQLVSMRTVLTNRHSERSRELGRFQTLERRRQRTLRNVRARTHFATTRLDSLNRDEERLVNVLAALERARRAAVTAGDFRSADATITTADLGSLDWPADGEVLYRFGAAQGPDDTRINYQGIGIGVPVGTDVKAVASGMVDITDAFGTYGQMVFLNHGGGMYTVYLHLSLITVRKGQWVSAGTTIGQSGGATSDQGPHIEFQIRQTDAAGNAIALDPANWLRRRRR